MRDAPTGARPLEYTTQLCFLPGLDRPDDILPPVSASIEEQLRAAVRAGQIIAPVVVSCGGDIIDGRLRARIAGESHVAISALVVDVDAGERAYMRVALNCARRHLSAAARREIARTLLIADPQRSDRDIERVVQASRGVASRQRRELEEEGAIAPCRRAHQRIDQGGRSQVVEVGRPGAPFNIRRPWGAWLSRRTTAAVITGLGAAMGFQIQTSGHPGSRGRP